MGYRLLLRAIDLVISVSHRTADQLHQVLGVPAARLRVAPTGIPEALFDISSNGRSDAFNVLFLGALSPEKDPLRAVEAFAIVIRETPARLRLVGSGPLENALRMRIQEMGLAETVDLIGSVTDVRPHLGWADVLLLTSRTEGLPAAVLEAAAAGVPAVAFDVGGVRETMLGGLSGLLIDRGDVTGAAKGLLFFARQPNERWRFGQEAKHFVREKFLLDASIARYHQLLTGLVDARR